MTIQQFFMMLGARWRIATGTLFFVVAVALIVSLVLPKQYSSTATVVIDAKASDPISGALGVTLSPAYMATQVDIINSDRVATRVVKLLKLENNPQTVEQWKAATEGRGDLERWLADYLKKNLDVKPSRESSVINLAYTSPDPRFAAALANAFAQAYIDTTLELRVEPARQSATWFDERSRALRENMEKAQTALSSYQREHGIVAADERLDVENSRLAELSAQLTGIQAQTVDTLSRKRQAQGDQLESSPDVMQNPLVQGLKSEIARNEAKLTELAGQLGPNHPQFQRLKAETDALKEKLTAEIQRVVGGLGTSSKVSQQRESEIRASLDAQKDKILKLKQQRDELAVLTRDVETAQRAYDTVNQRLTQTSLESQVNLTNIALLNLATEPIAPSSPKTLKNLLIATFVGTLLGIGMAFMAEFIDRRIRSENDVTEFVGCSFLGVLQGREVRGNWLQRQLNGLIARFTPRTA